MMIHDITLLQAHSKQHNQSTFYITESETVFLCGYPNAVIAKKTRPPPVQVGNSFKVASISLTLNTE